MPVYARDHLRYGSFTVMTVKQALEEYGGEIHPLCSSEEAEDWTEGYLRQKNAKGDLTPPEGESEPPLL